MIYNINSPDSLHILLVKQHSHKEDKNTSSEDKKEEETKKDYKNPETGAFLPMLPILILALASIVVWSKVKNKFMRI